MTIYSWGIKRMKRLRRNHFVIYIYWGINIDTYIYVFLLNQK